MGSPKVFSRVFWHYPFHRRTLDLGDLDAAIERQIDAAIARDKAGVHRSTYRKPCKGLQRGDTMGTAAVARMTGPAKRMLLDYYPMVRRVVDATTGWKARLRVDDIVKATPASCTNCPGARCIKHGFPGTGVIMTRCIALVIRGTVATRYIVSAATRRSVINKADLSRTGDVGKIVSLVAPPKHNRLGFPHQEGQRARITPKPRSEAVAYGTNLPLAQGLRKI